MPVITVPGAQTITAGEATAISGVSLAETDAPSGDFTVTLTDTSGDLSVTDTSNGDPVYGAGTNDLTIVGTLDQVNADLATLTDTEASAGSDTIAVNAYDSNNVDALQQTIAVAAGSGGGEGGTDTWTGTGDWTDGSHWSAGSPPNTGDAAAIASDNAQINSDLTLDGNAIQNDAEIDVSVTSGAILTLDDNTSITGGTLSIGNYGTLDIELGPSDITNPDATLDGVTVYNDGFFGTIEVGESSSATLLLDDGTTVYGGTLSTGNYGTLDIELGPSDITSPDATLDGVTVYNGDGFLPGTIEVGESSSATLLLDDGTTVYGGTLTIGSGGELDVELGSNGGNGATLDGVTVTNYGAIDVDLNASGAILTLDDGTTVYGGTLTIGSSGELDVELGSNGGNGATLDGVTVTNYGAIDVDLNASGAILTLDDGTTISGGTLTIGSSSGAIQGAGTIGTGVALQNDAGGTIDADVSGQTLTINTGNTVQNAGTLEATSGGILQIEDGVDNTGTLEANGGTIELGSNFNFIAGNDNENEIVTLANGGTLQLDYPANFANPGDTISGFASGDAIDLPSLTYSSSEYAVWNQAAGTLRLYNGATVEDSFQLSGSYSSGDFAVTANGSGPNAGTDVVWVDTWTGGGSDQNWLDPADWSSGVPASSDQAQIGGGYTVSLAGTTTVGSLVLASTAALDITSGTLTVSGEGSVNAGMIDLSGGATLAFDGNVDNLGGTVETTGGDNSLLSLTNATIANGTLSLGATDTLSVGNGDKAALDDVSVTNAGNINVAPGATLTLDDGTTVSGGTLTLDDLTSRLDIEPGSSSIDVTLDGVTVTNAGVIVVDPGLTDLILSGGTTINGGTLTIGFDAGEVDISGSATFDNVGVNNGFVLQIDNDATLTVAAIVVFEGGGEVSMGPGSEIAEASTDTGAIVYLDNSDNVIEGTGQIGAGTGLLTLTNFADGTIDANISGQTLTLDTGAAIANAGTLEATSGGILQIDDTVNEVNEFGTGTIEVNGGTVEITSNANASGDSVTFTGTGGTLQLDSSESYGGTIAHFGGNDVVDLTDLTFSSTETDIWNSAAGTLTIANGTQTATVSLAGSYAQDDFALTADNNGNTEVIASPTTVTVSGGSGNDAVEGSTIAATLGSSLQNVVYTWLDNGIDVQTGAGDSYTVGGDTGHTLALLISFTDPNNSNQTDTVTAYAGTIMPPPTDSWTGGGASGDWYDANNWSDGVPGPYTPVVIDPGSTLILSGMIDNLGTITLEGGPNYYNVATLQIAASGATLEGGGQITLSNSPYNQIIGASPGATLTNVDNTISGGGYFGFDPNTGNTYLTLTNDAGGIIDATAALYIDTGGNTVTNAGLLEATGGGALYIESAVDNTGIIEALAGSTVYLSDVTIDSTQGVIEAVGTGSQIELQDATITGGVSLGTIEAAKFYTSEFDGSVTPFANTADVIVDGAGTLELAGTIDNVDTITLTSPDQSHDYYFYSPYSATLEIEGSVTLEGGGQVILAINPIGGGSYGYYNNIVGSAAGSTLTNVDNTISGGGYFGFDPNTGNTYLTLTNDAGGIIDATAALYIDTGGNTVTNAGLLEATGGGALYIESAVDNTGIIEALAGSTVYLSDVTIDSTQGVIEAVGTGSQIELQDATITGGVSLGTIEAAKFYTSEFDGSVTPFANTADVIVDGAGTLELAGTIDNFDTITLTDPDQSHDYYFYSPYSATLEIEGSVTLEGGGQVILAINPIGGGSYGYYNNIVGSAAGSTLTNVDNTISGGGDLGYAYSYNGNINTDLTLVNEAGGTIDATGTIDIYTGSNTTTNAGLLEASGGGTLSLDSTVDNFGTIYAANDSTVAIYGTINNSGAGIFETAGDGVIKLESATVTGTLTTAAGTTVEVSGGTSVFDGSLAPFTNAGDVVVDPYATLELAGTIDNTGSIALNGYSSYYSEPATLEIGAGGVTLEGGGQITLSDSSPDYYNFISGASAGATLTNVDNTISGGGDLGYAYSYNGNINTDLTLVNEAGGTIDATGTIDIYTGSNTTTNAGLLEASGGGTLSLDSTVDNFGTIYAANDSTVAIYGTINNSGAGIFETAGDGVIKLESATVTDTLTTAAGTTVEVSGGTSVFDGSPGGGFDNVTDLSQLNFATSDQSMWGTGQAASIDQSLTLFDSGPQSVALASGELALNASLMGNAGAVSVSYPIDAAIQTPDAVVQGQDFTVATSDAGILSPALNATFPNLSVSLDAVISAQGYGVNISNQDVSLFSLGSGDEFTWGPSGADSQITFTASIPDGYTTTTTTEGTGALPSVTLDGTTADFASGSVDLVSLLSDAALADGIYIPPLSGIISAVLSGGFAVAQQFTFLPTGLDVTFTPNFDPSAQQSGPLGSSFTFQVPTGWNEPVDLSATYSLAGELFSQTGFVGNADINLSLLSGLFSQDFPLYTSTPSYLLNLGDFPLTGFNTVSDTYVIPLTFDSTANDASPSAFTNAGNVSIDGGGTLDLIGTIDNAGSIALNGFSYYYSEPATLDIDAGGVTLEGGGQVTLSGSPNYILGASVGATLTNVDNTISGGGEIGQGDSNLTLVNEAGGTIDANVPGSTLTLDTGDAITNYGTLEATNGGTLVIDDSVNGNGMIEVNGGTVDFANTNTSVDNATFGSGGGTLELAQPADFHGTISAISGSGDVLDLAGFAATDTASTAGGFDSSNDTTTLTVYNSSDQAVQTLTLEGNYSSAAWTVTSDNSGGIDVADPPAATVAAIAAGASLDISAPSNETVTFTGGADATGALVLNDPESFTGQIVGFTGTAPDAAHSDTIDLVGINYDSAQFAETYNSSTGLLTVTDGTNSASFTFDNFNATLDFASDGNGGTLITDPPATGSAGDSSTGGLVKWGMDFGSDNISLDAGQSANHSDGAAAPDGHNAAPLIGDSGYDNFVFHPSLGAEADASPHVDGNELANSHPASQLAQQLTALVTPGPHEALFDLIHDDMLTPNGVIPAQFHHLTQAGHLLH